MNNLCVTKRSMFLSKWYLRPRCNETSAGQYFSTFDQYGLVVEVSKGVCLYSLF